MGGVYLAAAARLRAMVLIHDRWLINAGNLRASWRQTQGECG